MSTMAPIEFVLWLDGASDMVAGDAPTPAQWEKMKENLSAALAGIVAKKLLEKAEAAHRHENELAQKQQMEAEYQKLRLQQLMEQAKQQAGIGRFPGAVAGIANHQTRVTAYAEQYDDKIDALVTTGYPGKLK